MTKNRKPLILASLGKRSNDLKPWTRKGKRYGNLPIDYLSDYYLWGYDPRSYTPRGIRVNPLLEAYRFSVENAAEFVDPEWGDPLRGDTLGWAERWLWYVVNGEQDVSHKKRHVEHATRVLSRILAVYGE